jgi:hypothetical protein
MGAASILSRPQRQMTMLHRYLFSFCLRGDFTDAGVIVSGQ